MAKKTPIIYRDFWDVPRAFVARHANIQLYFDCKFDDSIEDYGDSYNVYVLPSIPDAELKSGSWTGLEKRATEFVGIVAIADIHFDPTVRKEADVSVVSPLLKAKNLLSSDG